MAHEGNDKWLAKWLRLEPHQIIGDEKNPYLKRWYIIPRNRFLNIYLHQFLRSDDDRALHDHPWWFASLLIRGAYWEHRQDRPLTYRSLRRAPSLAFRRADTAHRVELDGDAFDEGWREFPAWTLIVTGPREREWGFLCPQGWRHWEKFVHDNGCGEQ